MKNVLCILKVRALSIIIGFVNWLNNQGVCREKGKRGTIWVKVLRWEWTLLIHVTFECQAKRIKFYLISIWIGHTMMKATFWKDHCVSYLRSVCIAQHPSSAHSLWRNHVLVLFSVHLCQIHRLNFNNWPVSVGRINSGTSNLRISALFKPNGVGRWGRKWEGHNDKKTLVKGVS